jgi:adenylylsulfate kinase
VTIYRDSHTRSIAKAISWRALGSLATSALVFAVTRRWALSVFVVGFEFVLKSGLYWLHERMWDHLRYGKKEITPSVLWFTGLSGAGKSTISQEVAGKLRRMGLKVEQLDGDSVRGIFPNTGFTRSDRDEHIRRVGYLASKLEQHGVTVVASFVSPYRETREVVRGMCKSFIEVYVNTPLEECERRDVKGLYAKARRGEIGNFTGISDPYEPPERAELLIDTRTTALSTAVDQVVDVVRRRMS